MSAPFTVHIPEEGYPKLLAFLDEEFPHCTECGGRMIPRKDNICPDCEP